MSIANKNIWAKTIEGVLKNTEKTWYKIPDNITVSLVNPISGKVNDGNKNAILFYINGTEPDIN